MKALDRKLVRDLSQMRGQVLTIALVVASAVAGFVGTLSTYVSLDRAREAFYREAHFADVFVSLKRAPSEFAARIAAIRGVADVQATVVFDATLDLPGAAEPLVARMVGIEPAQARRLNRLYLRRGRMIDPAHPHEAIVSEAFAATRGLGPGSEATVLLNGRRETLRIVGVGLSPDYVYATQGGAFPDDRQSWREPGRDRPCIDLGIARPPRDRREGCNGHAAAAPGVTSPLDSRFSFEQAPSVRSATAATVKPRAARAGRCTCMDVTSFRRRES